MQNDIYDVVVIGGGPAGMMAAGRAAELGAKVILIEKNKSLGVKLLITGGGRCNVTNAELDTRKLLEKYKDDSKYLFSTFSQFGVKETLDFFHNRGMQTKVENENRVFPVSDKSESVLDVLVEYMKAGRVDILLNSSVTGFETDTKINAVKISKNKTIFAKTFIIATGGTSRPETGSTGDAFAWLRLMGHKVMDPTPSLVPIASKEKWVHELSGLTLSDIKLTTFQNETRQQMKRGKLLFTHTGFSGPTVLNMSKDIGELLKYGEVMISIDLLPDQDYSVLNFALQKLFKDNINKKIKNVLDTLIPTALIPKVLDLSKIDPDKECHSVTREERLTLMKVIKDIRIKIDGLLGADKAIITNGGVVLDEVDWKTMKSKLMPNLFLVGDILNIDRPSGGYSLQLCWTTGFVAGSKCIS